MPATDASFSRQHQPERRQRGRGPGNDLTRRAASRRKARRGACRSTSSPREGSNSLQLLLQRERDQRATFRPRTSTRPFKDTRSGLGSRVSSGSTTWDTGLAVRSSSGQALVLRRRLGGGDRRNLPRGTSSTRRRTSRTRSASTRPRVPRRPAWCPTMHDPSQTGPHGWVSRQDKINIADHVAGLGKEQVQFWVVELSAATAIAVEGWTMNRAARSGPCNASTARRAWARQILDDLPHQQSSAARGGLHL